MSILVFLLASPAMASSECMDFHCAVTAATFADAPLLFVGDVVDLDRSNELGNGYGALFRVRIDEAIHGVVHSGELDLVIDGLGPPVGSKVLVAAQGIVVTPCELAEAASATCVEQVFGDVVHTAFKGAVIFEAEDGALDGSGRVFGPVCFNGTAFDHSKVGEVGAPCPPDYAFTFSQLVDAVRAHARSTEDAPIQLPGVRE